MNKSPIQDGVQEINLGSWREFFDLTIDDFAEAPAYIYRGQCNYDWRLQSSLERV